MRKFRTIGLLILGGVILFIFADLIAIYFFDKPLLEIKEGEKYKSLFYDVYDCPQADKLLIKFKGSKFSCSEIKSQYAYTIETIETNNCDGALKEYYVASNKTIYTYCLDSIIINNGTDKIELSEYLNDERINVTIQMEEIMNSITKVKYYKDDGTTEYRDSGVSEFTNNGLTIIECNRKITDKKYNKDIYIGPKNMKYEETLCN